MRNRELIEQGFFRESEDGGVRADAEREGEDGDGGESGRFAKDAQSVADVGVKRFQPEAAALLVAVLFHAVQRAELQHGLAARYFGRQAGGDVCRSLPLEVETQLVAQFLI